MLWKPISKGLYFEFIETARGLAEHKEGTARLRPVVYERFAGQSFGVPQVDDISERVHARYIGFLFLRRRGFEACFALKITSHRATFRGGSVCLNRFQGFLKWFSALVTPLPHLAVAD
jgi:hypothetical protein